MGKIDGEKSPLNDEVVLINLGEYNDWRQTKTLSKWPPRNNVI